MNVPRPQKTSALAIVAVVLAVICAPIGFVLGIIAYIRINNSGGELGGKGLALVAIIVPSVLIPIGLLAAIAIPSFVRYPLKSKTSEVKTNLRALRTHQEAYRAELDFYSSCAPNPSGPPAGGKTPWEERPCPSECGPKMQSACNECSCLGFTPYGPVAYRYACTAIPGGGDEHPEFTCAAIGDLDGDGRIAAWVYGSGNRKGATKILAPIPELARELCRGQVIPAAEVFDCTPGVY